MPGIRSDVVIYSIIILLLPHLKSSQSIVIGSINARGQSNKEKTSGMNFFVLIKFVPAIHLQMIIYNHLIFFLTKLKPPCKLNIGISKQVVIVTVMVVWVCHGHTVKQPSLQFISNNCNYFSFLKLHAYNFTRCKSQPIHSQSLQNVAK